MTCESIPMSQPQRDKKFDNLLVAVILAPGQLSTYLWRASTESAPTTSTPSDHPLGHLRLPSANLYPLRTSSPDADTLTTGIFTKQPQTGTRLSVSVIPRSLEPQQGQSQAPHQQHQQTPQSHQQQQQQHQREDIEAVKPETQEDAPNTYTVAFRDRRDVCWVRRLAFDPHDRLVEVGVPVRERRPRCLV